MSKMQNLKLINKTVHYNRKFNLVDSPGRQGLFIDSSPSNSETPKRY